MEHKDEIDGLMEMNCYWATVFQLRISSGEKMWVYSNDKLFPHCIFSGKSVCVCVCVCMSNPISCMGELGSEYASSN